MSGLFVHPISKMLNMRVSLYYILYDCLVKRRAKKAKPAAERAEFIQAVAAIPTKAEEA